MKTPPFLAGLSVLACVTLLAGCPLPPPIDAVAPFDSRVLEYHPVDSTGAVSPDPSFTVVYDSTNTASGRFEMSYDENGYPIRTDIYQYEDDGLTTTLIGWYIYTYEAGPMHRITGGETFNAEGSRLEYYTVTWDAGYNYTDITDYKVAGGTDIETAHQIATYLKGADPAAGFYRTEQYITCDDAGVENALKKEYAAWYSPPDAEGYVSRVCELYHVLRNADPDDAEILPQGADEAYFYVSYSYDAAGNTFLQSDSLYYGTPQRFTVTPAADDPFLYQINASLIGNQTDMILWEYDEYNMPIKASFYLGGVLQETKTYTWRDPEHITTKARYINGGAMLAQKEQTTYWDTTVDGRIYQVWENTTFSFDAAPAKSAAAPYEWSMAARSSKSLGPEPDFSPTGLAGGDLVAAYAERTYRKVRGLHD